MGQCIKKSPDAHESEKAAEKPCSTNSSALENAEHLKVCFYGIY